MQPRLHNIYTVAVPEDVRRRVRAMLVGRSQADVRRILSLSETTFAEVISLGGRVRSDTLARIQRVLVMEGVK